MTITKREPGRPTLCTPEMVDALVARVRAGVPINRACGAVGIAQTTFYNWVRLGEEGGDGNEIYVQFLDRVTQAKNQTCADLAEVITTAAMEGDVKAAQWYLERADRHNWSKATETTINVNSAPQAPVIDASVTVEELEAELEEMSE